MNYPPSVYVLVPLTDEAEAWLEEYCSEAQWYSGGIVVEHRYIDDILLGIEEDGLKDEFELTS